MTWVTRYQINQYFLFSSYFCRDIIHDHSVFYSCAYNGRQKVSLFSILRTFRRSSIPEVYYDLSYTFACRLLRCVSMAVAQESVRGYGERTVSRQSFDEDWLFNHWWSPPTCHPFKKVSEAIWSTFSFSLWRWAGISFHINTTNNFLAKHCFTLNAACVVVKKVYCKLKQEFSTVSFPKVHW